MKKLIFIIFCLISTFCFAQEPKPEGPIYSMGTAQFYLQILSGDTAFYMKSQNFGWVHIKRFSEGGGGSSGVTTFNTRAGDVVLLNADVAAVLLDNDLNLGNAFFTAKGGSFNNNAAQDVLDITNNHINGNGIRISAGDNSSRGSALSIYDRLGNNIAFFYNNNIQFQVPITIGTWSADFGAVSGANLTNLTAANISAGTAGINISGNSATSTNGVVTTGSYANPAFIISLASTKITGLATVATSGSYIDLINKPSIYTFSGASNQLTLGDGTYITRNTSNIPEVTNLYYTDARVGTYGDTHYYPLSGNPSSFVITELDPTVPSYSKTLTAFSVIQTNTDPLYRPITYVPTFASITSKPTTLSGYGITDAYPLSGNPSNFLTGITSILVTNALGFTPYNATNPSNFLTANQTISFAPTGDVTGSTTGSTVLTPTLTIGTSRVTNTMLAGSIAASKLIGTDIITIGTLSTGSIPYSLLTGTPTIPIGANPSASLGLTAINGSSTSFMRADGAPALDITIVPVWTGLHTFRKAAITTANTSAILLDNNTSALVGTTLQYSPSLRFTGHAWNTSGTPATNQEDFLIQMRTLGGGAPRGALYFSYSNSTTTTPSYSDAMFLDNTGLSLNLGDLIVGNGSVNMSNAFGAYIIHGTNVLFGNNTGNTNLRPINAAGLILFQNNAGTNTDFSVDDNGVAIARSNISSGIAGTTIGGYKVSGNTSGTISILPQAAAGTYNFNLPITAGNTGQILTSQGGSSTAMTWTSLLNYAHTIFTPTTGGTVSLVNNQYNIINPAGALLALTVNLPSSPANGDVVYIKFTQNVTTVTYANGTVVDGITTPTAGGLTILNYDTGTTSWY